MTERCRLPHRIDATTKQTRRSEVQAYNSLPIETCRQLLAQRFSDISRGRISNLLGNAMTILKALKADHDEFKRMPEKLKMEASEHAARAA